MSNLSYYCARTPTQCGKCNGCGHGCHPGNRPTEAAIEATMSRGDRVQREKVIKGEKKKGIRREDSRKKKKK